MKKLLFLLSISLCYSISSAQETATFKVGRVYGHPKLESISSKSLTIYAPSENKFVIADSVSCDGYFVIFSGKRNQVSRWKCGMEMWILDTIINANDSVTAFICKLSGTDTVVVSTQRIAVKKQPPPLIGFNGKPLKDSISKQKLLKYKMFSIYNDPDYYYARGEEFSSYDLQIGKKKFHSGVIKIVSSAILLTPAMIRALKKAPLGSTISFSNIQLCMPTVALMLNGSSVMSGSYEQRKKGLACWPMAPVSSVLIK